MSMMNINRELYKAEQEKQYLKEKINKINNNIYSRYHKFSCYLMKLHLENYFGLHIDELNNMQRCIYTETCDTNNNNYCRNIVMTFVFNDWSIKIDIICDDDTSFGYSLYKNIEGIILKINDDEYLDEYLDEYFDKFNEKQSLLIHLLISVYDSEYWKFPEQIKQWFIKCKVNKPLLLNVLFDAIELFK